MSHPFDAEAVEAAAKAIHDHWQSHQAASRSWGLTLEKLPGMADDYRAKATAALTAACNSMMERGMAREGYSPPWDDGTIMVNTRKYTETNIPVTIIRPKRPQHG